MDLRQWIDHHGFGSLRALSKKSGVPYETLWRAADRRHRLRSDYAARIIEATDGAVTLEALSQPPLKRGGAGEASR